MTIPYGVISEEALAELRSRIGVEIKNPPQPYIEVATKDAIRHFAYGIGDDNPLWTDEEYASRTKYGGIIAPPCILYAMDRIVSGYVGGLPGVHALFAGTDWEWFRPVRVNEQIKARSRLKDLIVKKSRFAKRAVKQVYEVSFYNQEDEPVAKADSWCFRTERHTARQEGKYVQINFQTYTQEQLQAIMDDYEKEERRGAQPRYWEDVQVGEEIPHVVKGPLTVTGIIAWNQGWGGLYIRAHRLAIEQYKKHPALGILNAQGIPDVPERVHWEHELARNIGAPGAYDYGPERVSWLGHLMTNWMGDDGFLKRLYVEVRRFNVVGDTTWCKGKVIRKYVEHDQSCVECEVWAVNQRGEVTAKGMAVVVLPTRGG